MTAIRELVRHGWISSPKSVGMVDKRDAATLCPVTAAPDDLIRLNPVTIGNVVSCLERRYYQDKFYTRAESTLVAVNPFKPVPQLYGDLAIRTYKQNAKGSQPHVYSIGDEARKLCVYDTGPGKQSIVVSGESGAGKTETAKHLLKYLSSVCAGENCGQIEQRILDANPILESFGNAKTCRNDNSSRFGKYIQISLNHGNRINGAQVHTYLLEKTRLVSQANDEGNFHIFYQLLSGIGDNERQSLFLDEKQAKDFVILQKSTQRSSDDSGDFQKLRVAMVDIGVDEKTLTEIFKLLAAILHLSNVTLLEDREAESVRIHSKEYETDGSLSLSCRLLGVDRLDKALTTREITAAHSRRKSVFSKTCSVEEAVVRKHALAKLIYSRLFDWLVDHINEAIRPKSTVKSIGILDIYGFECFKENSLEQLCINYANEKLQQHFVSSFLKELQDEYESEAVFWERVQFADNKKCLSLLEANPSVFSILDEECYLNRPTNEEVVYCRMNECLKTHVDWSRPRCARGANMFTVRHYAGNVTYNVAGLVEKNKDNIPAEFVKLLQNSQNSFVRQLVVDVESNLVPTPTRKQKTVLSKFKASLDSLMSTLRSSHCHYIRCIKPNAGSVSAVYESGYVKLQLTACGLAESVEICRNGFPSRMTYAEFLKRYGLLVRFDVSWPPSRQLRYHGDDDDKENATVALEIVTKAIPLETVAMDMDERLDVLYERQLTLDKPSTPRHKRRRRTCVSSDDHARKCCASIMKQVFGDLYIKDQPWNKQFGKTKLFLRDGELERLEMAKSDALGNYAVRLQMAWRSRQVRKAFLQKRQCVIRLQAAVRGWLARRRTRLLRDQERTLAEVYGLIHELETSLCSLPTSLNHESDLADENWQLSSSPTSSELVPVSGVKSFSIEMCTQNVEPRRLETNANRTECTGSSSLPTVLEEVRALDMTSVAHLNIRRGIASIRQLSRALLFLMRSQYFYDIGTGHDIYLK